MIKKILIGFGIFLALIYAYWVISPLFINKVVQEDLPEVMNKDELVLAPRKIASGNFIGFDEVHNGKGEASIYEIDGKKILRFEEGFSVQNGPDLYVGFGKEGKYVKGSEISKLKGNIGSQNYEIPENFGVEKYDSVYVWCKAFSTPFIKADLVYLK